MAWGTLAVSPSGHQTFSEDDFPSERNIHLVPAFSVATFDLRGPLSWRTCETLLSEFLRSCSRP
jgi:hypothetical protein